MSDRKLTLFELHFDEGFQIGPKTVGFGGGSDEDDESEESGLLGLGGDDEDGDEEEIEEHADDIEGESDEGSPVSLLLGVVALALVAAVVRRLLGDDEELEIETPDEQEDVEEFESAD